jgi:hypothetical protein
MRCGFRKFNISEIKEEQGEKSFVTHCGPLLLMTNLFYIQRKYSFLALLVKVSN